MSACTIVLKEWAVTVRALDQGRQVVLLRKGGIREEGEEFRVVEPEFLLYPTYEHQREDLLKPEWREELRATLTQPRRAEAVVFRHWARVAEVWEVREREKVESLAPRYLWTPEYALSRLHWKPGSPLLVLAVRVYRMAQEQAVAASPEYAGCRSWVRLQEAVELGKLDAVMSEEEFQAEVENIKIELCGKN
jgi:hypothetical protein